MKGKRRRVLVGLFMTFVLVLNSLVYAGVKVNSNGVPEEISSSEGYVEIPVKDQDGKVTGALQQTMTKNGNTGNVIFWVKAYAYKTANQIKTGVVITYPAEDGTMPIEFFDQIQTLSLEDANWPSCEGLYIQKNKPFEYSGPNENEKRIRLYFKCGKGGEFDRYSEKDVAFAGDLGTVDLTVLNGGEEEIDNYNATLNPASLYGNQNIFGSVKKVKPNSKVNVDLDITISANSKDPRYQVIISDTIPTLPLEGGTWETLTTLEKIENGIKEYPHFDDTPNYVSVQHYIYAPGYERSSASYGSNKARDKEKIFQYPVGDWIRQKAVVSDYYTSKEDGNAFFNNNLVTSTTLKADFVPPTSGEYQLCVRSAQGAWGKITVGTNDIVFVNDKNAKWTEQQPQYRHNKETFKLEAGQSYPIEIQTQHNSNKDISPHLMYKLKDEKDWHIAYPNVLKNQDPSNGASRAAKFWGFIVPDISGTFNFGLYADDGAYGFIMDDGVKRVFVDSFNITSAQDQSNGVEITIKKDKVYPFYLEWYEGCPQHEALKPRYKIPNSDNWQDIPASWFRPSTDSTVAKEPLAVFKPVGTSAQIPLLNEKGKQYVVVEVTDQYGNSHQILEGPLAISEETPVVETPPTSKPEYNCVVPEEMSNVTTKVTYKTPCQDISYKIDLSTLFNKTIAGECLFNLKTTGGHIDTASNQFVVILEEGGTKQIVQPEGSEAASDRYIYTVSGKELKISLKEAEKTKTVNADTEHKISIYFKVGLGEKIAYEGATNSYRALLKEQEDSSSAIIQIPIDISRKPLISTEETYDGDGNPTTIKNFATTPTVNTVQIPITLFEIPKVY